MNLLQGKTCKFAFYRYGWICKEPLS